MHPLEIIVELCTVDSAYVRGWRWLFSARYRASVSVECGTRHKLFVVAGILETLLVMAAEIIAVVFLIGWLAGL